MGGFPKKFNDSVTMKHFNLLDALIDYEIFFIVEKIFLHLDTESLNNAECASPKKWGTFIQSSQKLYHKKVATLSSWWSVKSSNELKNRPKVPFTVL